tara:strand:- start:67 stop:252 length:186 start_codon:yes stop_codon:yes gene_type:complete
MSHVKSYASSKISPEITYSKSLFAEAVNLNKSVSSRYILLSLPMIVIEASAGTATVFAIFL